MDRDKRERGPVAERVLPFQAIEMAMVVLIRRKSAFMIVNNLLTPDHFVDTYPALYVLWSALQKFFNEFRKLPRKPALLANVEHMCMEMDGFVTEGDHSYLRKLIRKAFVAELKDLDRDWAVAVIRRYMEEQLAARVQAFLGDEKQKPSQLQEALRPFQVEAQAIASLQGDVTELPFPDGWAPEIVGLTSTNLDFFDTFLGGGQAPTEVYGLLGPTGSCKTTLALQLGIEGADRCRRRKRQQRTKARGLCYLVSYESPIKELRLRALACAARVERSPLEEHGFSQLSTSRRPKDYERALYAEAIQNGKFQGEQERIERARALLNDHFRILDMTGTDQAGGLRGAGYVGEIAGRIANDLRANPNTFVEMIMIDYAGAMIDKYISMNELSLDIVRSLLSKLPLRVRDQLAIPFNCPVWILHQLAGAANAKASGAKMHHTDAADCKSFAENLSFAFVMGTTAVVDGNSLCVMYCSKHRRQPPRPEQVLRVDGGLGRVHGTDNMYVLDVNTHRIVSRNERAMAGQIGIAEPARQPRAAFNPMAHYNARDTYE